MFYVKLFERLPRLPDTENFNYNYKIPCSTLIYRNSITQDKR
uniref:Uncharacterized protein n=1 Tax=Anguilla anguilla TaxID=7936 RepID=A0A0E9WE80_ANGAN